MYTITAFLLSLLIGLLGFFIFNDPIRKPRRTKKRLPKVKYKNFEILPYFRIHYRQKTYHIHHWLTLSVVTVLSITLYGGVSHVELIRGAALGGIIHGLSYKDRFKFRFPRIR